MYKTLGRMVISTSLLTFATGAAMAEHVSFHDDRPLETARDDAVCLNYGLSLRGAMTEEYGAKNLAVIEERGLLSAADRNSIETVTLHIGMSRCALIATWGAPGEEDMHRSVTKAGVVDEWVYPPNPSQLFTRVRHTKTDYVYMEDGVVVGWKN